MTEEGATTASPEAEAKATDAAAAIAIKDGMVLLVREEESSAHLTGKLGLPGGRLQPGEDYLQAAMREFTEETGLVGEGFESFPGNFFQGEIERKSGMVKFNWMVFRVGNFSGRVESPASKEVTPLWVKIEDLEQMNREGKLIGNVFNAIQAALKVT
jgi:ADP-ribose pyrophosphatase YjhB (NUDIX family)